MIVLSLGFGPVFVAVTTAANAGVPGRPGGPRGIAAQRLPAARRGARAGDLHRAGDEPHQGSARPLTPRPRARSPPGFSRGLAACAAFLVAAAVIGLRATNTRGEQRRRHGHERRAGCADTHGRGRAEGNPVAAAIGQHDDSRRTRPARRPLRAQPRPTCAAVAYRMLGSLSEADDAVQEAWLRLSRVRRGRDRQPRRLADDGRRARLPRHAPRPRPPARGAARLRRAGPGSSCHAVGIGPRA